MGLDHVLLGRAAVRCSTGRFDTFTELTPVSAAAACRGAVLVVRRKLAALTAVLRRLCSKSVTHDSSASAAAVLQVVGCLATSLARIARRLLGRTNSAFAGTGL